MAVLLAFISYPKYSHTYLRFFPWLLLYVLLTEVFAIPIYEAFETNVVLYNVYNVVFFMYFYFIFYKKEENKRNRVWIKTVAGIFILASIINLSFRSFIFQPQLLAYIVGACALILCIILYFIDILYTPQILNIRKDLLFWVSTGLLLFYVGYIPIKVTRHFFEEPGHEFGTLMIVHRILILVMNICFIIGFLWTRKK
ncbi:hypothetical protein [Marinirhabdus gelatinilytica]|nr:hypothetical protein [Marinirhabdus gelatinilytica]